MNANWRKDLERKVSLEEMVGVGCAILFLTGMVFYACTKHDEYIEKQKEKVVYHTNQYRGVWK